MKLLLALLLPLALLALPPAAAEVGVCAGDYQVGASCTVNTWDFLFLGFRTCDDGWYALHVGIIQTACIFWLP